jgi:hypothetical protein
LNAISHNLSGSSQPSTIYDRAKAVNMQLTTTVLAPLGLLCTASTISAVPLLSPRIPTETAIFTFFPLSDPNCSRHTAPYYYERHFVFTSIGKCYDLPYDLGFPYTHVEATEVSADFANLGLSGTLWHEKGCKGRIVDRDEVADLEVGKCYSRDGMVIRSVSVDYTPPEEAEEDGHAVPDRDPDATNSNAQGDGESLTPFDCTANPLKRCAGRQ